MAAWFVGPELVTRYQYASTRGRIAAEYEYASQQLTSAPLEGVSSAYQLVAQKIRPSVVSVLATDHDVLVPDANGGQSGVGGQGSGVIMSDDGYIITNDHVIDGLDHVTVVLDDLRQFRARVVGRDSRSDLAVLKINARGLMPAEWGDSDELQVGSMVWAVGNPYGLKQTVTSGILSAKERPSELDGRGFEFLQTDAAINPGNSGGPLVNARGQVIGINTSIYGESFLGISFAVPSSIARFVFEQIVDNGRVTRGFLGINPNEVSSAEMMRHGMRGALVTRVEDATPARYADLRPGDIIRRWDGKTITSWNTLYHHIARSRPHSVVDVEILRDGTPLTLQVAVGDWADYSYL
jgi:serine protease Do